ncbi:MAG: helix-turn-helix domain-containing protein [Phycisphaera sp. RhM]|nr:helix-turn-helix domain-containing protein [Phycisphaera sp. RhM]
MDHYFTPKQAAEILQLSVDTIRGLIGDGSLKAANVGRGRVPRWRISKEELESFHTRRILCQRGKSVRRRRSLIEVRHV